MIPDFSDSNRTSPARALWSVVVAVTIGIIATMTGPPPGRQGAAPGYGDVATFGAIVDRIARGEAYYEATGAELRAGGYPTAQVLNWRTPLLLTGIAASPVAARGAFLALGIGVAFLTIALLRPLTVAIVGGAIQLGMLLVFAVPTAIFMAEVWAGALIVLSLCAYIRSRPFAGGLLGLSALFVRELAAPYCAGCAVAAVVNRRWREAVVWLTGLLLYVGYVAWHVTAVWSHQLPTDVAHTDSWLQFGGLQFVLTIVATHVFLVMQPLPVIVAALMLVVAGIASRATPMPIRIASATYLLFFLAVGQGFNTYWAYLIWPTWSLASGFGAHEILQGLAYGTHYAKQLLRRPCV